MPKKQDKKVVYLHSIELFAEEAGQLPTEFKILEDGITDSCNGEILFDDQAKQLVMQTFESYGTPLFIDYNHKFEEAAAWFIPAIIDGQLWATNVEWTEEASQQLLSKKYRFMSPALMMDQKDDQRRVIELVNVALTNLPAIKNQKPLVHSRKFNMTDIIKKLSQATPAKHADAPADAPPADAPAEDASEPETLVDLLGAVQSALEADPVDVEGALKALDAAIQAAKDLDQAEDDSDGSADEPAQESAKVEASLTTLSKTLGLSEGQDIAVAFMQLRNENASLKASNEKTAKEALIKDLTVTGKLMPSMHKFAQTLSIAQLNEYAKTAEAKFSKEATPVSSNVITLSAEQLKICADMKISPEDYAKNLKTHN